MGKINAKAVLAMKVLYTEVSSKGVKRILFLEDNELKLKISKGKRYNVLNDERVWIYYNSLNLKISEVESLRFTCANTILENKRKENLQNQVISETTNAHLEELLKKLKFKFILQKTKGAIEKYVFNKTSSTYSLVMEFNNQTEEYKYIIMLQHKDTLNYYSVEIFDNEYDVIEYLENVSNWKESFTATTDNIPIAFGLTEYPKLYKRGNIVIDKNFKLICRLNTEKKCVPIGRGINSIIDILYTIDDENSWSRIAEG